MFAAIYKPLHELAPWTEHSMDLTTQRISHSFSTYCNSNDMQQQTQTVAKYVISTQTCNITENLHQSKKNLRQYKFSFVG